LDAFFQSFLLVALSEMGDKTQLLAFVLASRFRKPWVVLAGIFVATLLNHALATALGGVVASYVSPLALRYILAATFAAFGLWILVPDALDENEAAGGAKVSSRGAFLTTVVAFFLAEMGDKTQLATVALGARYNSPVWVTLGTTAGMMLTNGLAVAFGERLTRRVSFALLRKIACGLFLVFAAAIALGF
jgi:putative Ca2+/H+ antiporter (TMEM165/GDT1 family)